MARTMRQEQKEQTRQKILETAFILYSKHGFKTTTNAIAQEAGVAHGSIFVHFPKRDELQLYVLKKFAQEVGVKLHTLSVNDFDISVLLHEHIRVLEKYESFYRNMLTELATLPAEAKTVLVSLQSVMSLHFGTVIKQAQKAGTIKDIPLHMLFNTWLGLLHYYLQNGELFAPGASVLKRCGDELVDTFVTLISKSQEELK